MILCYLKNTTLFNFRLQTRSIDSLTSLLELLFEVAIIAWPSQAANVVQSISLSLSANFIIAIKGVAINTNIKQIGLIAVAIPNHGYYKIRCSIIDSVRVMDHMPFDCRYQIIIKLNHSSYFSNKLRQFLFVYLLIKYHSFLTRLFAILLNLRISQIHSLYGVLQHYLLSLQLLQLFYIQLGRIRIVLYHQHFDLSRPHIEKNLMKHFIDVTLVDSEDKNQFTIIISQQYLSNYPLMYPSLS